MSIATKHNILQRRYIYTLHIDGMVFRIINDFQKCPFRENLPVIIILECYAVMFTKVLKSIHTTMLKSKCIPRHHVIKRI